MVDPAVAVPSLDQDLLDAVPLLIASCDRDGRYLRVNRAYAERFGKTPSELIGRTMLEMVGPDVHASIEPLIQRVLAGERVEKEMTIRYRDLGEQTLRALLTPIHERSGAVVGWNGIGENITAQRIAEKRARDFAFLIENTADFVGISDLEFRPLFVNEAAARVAGIARPLSEISVFDVIAPEHHAFLREQFFPRVLSDGRARTELQFRNAASGETFWMEYSVLRMDDEGGRPTGYATISRSLAEHKRAEALLQQVARDRAEALARFQELADSMPQIVWSASRDGTIDYYNRQWFARTRTVGAADADPFTFIHPNDRPGLEERWRVALESGLPFDAEFRMRFPGEADFRWYLGRTVPVRDEQGAVVRWYGTSTDIDAQKRIESALARNQERLGAALDAAETGTFWWNMRTNELDWDDNLARLFGRARRSAVGALADLIELVHPDDRRRVLQACDRARREGADFLEEFRVVWPDGTVRWLYDKGRTYTDTDGRPHYMAGACVDVTLRREREEALRAADRQKDEFLGVLAHELRNPLAPLVFAVASLERRVTDGAARHSLDVMSRQIARISRLVDDLLDVSRVAQGKIVLQVEPLDVAAVVRHAAEAVRPALLQRRHELALDLEEPLTIAADPQRLGQIVENLIGNAVKYTPEGGRIFVSVTRQSDAAVIRVRDTGIGIAAEMLPRIFELFVQADNSLDRAQGGLGIGLALVNRLTQLHGGTVTVHSEGLSRGSEFVVRLPLVHPATAESDESIAAHRSGLAAS
jgi:PAS domain S-box-containing protein